MSVEGMGEQTMADNIFSLGSLLLQLLLLVVDVVVAASDVVNSSS